jgi:flagellar hook-associated protein 1 FlgK
MVEINPVTHNQPGSGSRAAGARRVMDTFVQRRMLGSHAYQGEGEMRSQALSPLDDLFSVDGLNLNDALDQFHDAMSQVTTHPSDHATRTVFLSRAQGLTRAFNQASATLEESRSDANDRIESEVNILNRKLEQIAELSQEIGQTEVGGVEAGDLRDERDQLIRQVAEVVPVSVQDMGNGQIRMLLGSSKTLVSADGKAHPLQATPNPLTTDMTVLRTSAGILEDVSGLLSSGRLRGLIDARDGGIADAKTALDNLAFDISSAFNTAHSAGFGLDGATGRNLFNPLAVAADAAKFMSLDAAVAGNPEAIAASSSAATLPGDNINALAMLDLQDSNIALGGTGTALEALSQMMGNAASEVGRARATASQADAINEQVVALHKSVSGVSVDEEMVALMQFQRGYQASLKVISTADQMLQEVINLKR